MAKLQSQLGLLSQTFSSLVNSPEEYLSLQEEKVEEFRPFTKDLYDATKGFEDKLNIKNEESLPELIIKNFDDEQVWQQLEINNNYLQKFFLQKISGLVAKKDPSLRPKPTLEIDNESVNDEEEELYESENDRESELEKEDNIIKKPKKIRSTVVDDEFFKVGELEEFLKSEEDKEKFDEEESDGDVDLFQESDNDDDMVGRSAKYEDFFDPPDSEFAEQNGNFNKIIDDRDNDNDEEDEDGDQYEDELNDDGDDEEFDMRDYDEKEEKLQDKAKLLKLDSSGDEDEGDVAKSTFEIRQKKVQQKIEQLEEANMSDKPWQLKGEVAAGTRPENSLLQEHLQFDHTTRQAPVVTEETTLTLEQLIKQRIKDQAWDDVVRKEKPKEEPFEFRKRLVLDQEKSKNSLAEIYEQEYLKQKHKDETEEEKELPEHETIRTMMTSLFKKLDALSNYHFTPQPPSSEIKIVNNLPAISVEEVAPSSVSNGVLLAPEEVMKRVSGNLKSDGDRTKEDKKHDRRKTKTKARLRKKEKEKREKLVKKLNPGLGNKYSKNEALKVLENMGAKVISKDNDDNVKSNLTSSKQFFTKLQDRILTGKNTEKKVKPKTKKLVKAAKIKL